MPGLNRRGPKNEGAMTGRRMGRCNPDNKGKTDEELLQNRTSWMQKEAQGMSRGQGRGRSLGKGMGRGMGLRHRGNA